MAEQSFDKGSKWLLHNQSRGALLVGGLTNVDRIEPIPSELVQPRKIPDGLLRVFLKGDMKPHMCLVEIATRAEKRALKQALSDLAIAYNVFGDLPELLMLVLSPKGKLRIDGNFAVRSDMGLASLAAKWKVVELWNLLAEEFLAEADVGVVPWVPLMRFDGQPEALLERCADRIRHGVRPQDQSQMLVVTQVLGSLKFSESLLANIFGGQTNMDMLEFPAVQRWQAGGFHKAILEVLKGRFGAVPRHIAKNLRALTNEKRLRKLSSLASSCKDLVAFQEALATYGEHRK